MKNEFCLNTNLRVTVVPGGRVVCPMKCNQIIYEGERVEQ